MSATWQSLAYNKHTGTRVVGALFGEFLENSDNVGPLGLTGAKQVASDEYRYRSLMRKELDEALISKLDQNNDGVDRAEFLTGMLVAMGCASERECKGILARFAKLDEDGSGKLTRDDMLGKIKGSDDI